MQHIFMSNRFLFIFFVFIICAKKINTKIINNIEITGNNRISSKTIIDYSGLKIGKDVNKYTLNNALKQIYRSGNFADVSIEDNKGKLIIKVLETPIIGDIFFAGSNK